MACTHPALILQPWETYKPNTSIDLTRHHEPKVLLDKLAYWTVKSLRAPTDIFFQVSPEFFFPRIASPVFLEQSTLHPCRSPIKQDD